MRLIEKGAYALHTPVPPHIWSPYCATRVSISKVGTPPNVSVRVLLVVMPQPLAVTRTVLLLTRLVTMDAPLQLLNISRGWPR